MPLTLAEVELLEERLHQAMLAGDVTTLDELLSERLRFVGLDGSNVDKAADLRAHRDDMLRVSRMEPGERHVELCGEVALVNVVVDLAGTFDGTAFSGRFRYTRAWYRPGDGRVQIVAGQVCAVQERPF